MPTGYGNPGAPALRERAHPERERNTGTSNNISALTVAGSAKAAAWLAALLRLRGLPWRVERWTGGRPSSLLVLASPDACAPFLAEERRPRQAVFSLDSPEGRQLAALNQVKAFTFSEGRDTADLTARELRLTGRSLTFLAVTRSAITRVAVGRQDLYPALAALACAVWLGVPLEEAGQTISGTRLRRHAVETQ